MILGQNSPVRNSSSVLSHEVLTRLGPCEPVCRGPGRAARANPAGCFASLCFPACLPRWYQGQVRRCHARDLFIIVTSILAEFSSFHFPGKKLDCQRELFVCAESCSWPVVDLGLEPSSADAEWVCLWKDRTGRGIVITKEGSWCVWILYSPLLIPGFSIYSQEGLG